MQFIPVDKGPFFFIEKKCHLVNDAGTIELENNNFATPNEIIDSGKDNQKILKEELAGADVCTAPKYWYRTILVKFLIF